jgi:hypothetical protein
MRDGVRKSIVDVKSRSSYRILLGEAEARCRRRRADEEVQAGVRTLNRRIIISNNDNPLETDDGAVS